jgi:hypothetical protein
MNRVIDVTFCYNVNEFLKSIICIVKFEYLYFTCGEVSSINICVMLCCKHFEFLLLFVIVSFMFKLIKLKICDTYNVHFHLCCIEECLILILFVKNVRFNQVLSIHNKFTRHKFYVSHG